jgi:hypothetical protein
LKGEQLKHGFTSDKIRYRNKSNFLIYMRFLGIYP